MKNPLLFIILLLHNHFAQWTHSSQNNTHKFSTWDYFPCTHVHGQTSCSCPQEAPICSSSALWNTSPAATWMATDFAAQLHGAPGISQDPGAETHHRMGSVLRFSLLHPFISAQTQTPHSSCNIADSVSDFMLFSWFFFLLQLHKSSLSF